MRLVFCQKLKKEAEGLERAPVGGVLGNRIFSEISKPAWAAWLSHQTMLINEYRLNLLDAKARAFCRTEMEKFLFGDGSEKPKGFVEPSLLDKAAKG